MKIISIYIKQGFLYTEKHFENRFNLIYSDKNSTGKTTLIRCLLYALGYNIPGTKNFKMTSIITNLLLEKDDGTQVHLKRIRDNIEYITDDARMTYSLPIQQNELHGILFGTENADILNNILGAIYADQEKGWTLLNRGKAIAGIRFNIDELIRGLSNRNCDDLLTRKKAVEENLKKYRQILNIAQYKDSIRTESDSFVGKKYNEDRFIKMSQLQVERDQLQSEIKRLDQNIKANTKAVDLIDRLKLIVRIPDGAEMYVTRNDIVGYQDSIDFLKAKKTIASTRLQKVLSELKRISVVIEEEDQQLSLFKIETLAESFDRNIIEVPINSVDVQRAISGLEKERTLINKEIASRTNSVNPVTQSMYETVKKYISELGDGTAGELSWKYLFTSNLKELSGAVLHKTVFSFRLAYILEIQKVLGIKLPIILDSPSGKEVDQNNIRQMMEILKRDFSDNQIIIASIYHYVEGEHVIEMKDRLLDSIIEVSANSN